jgi:hypothetical protein
MNGLSKTQRHASMSVGREAGIFQTNFIATDANLIGTKESSIIRRYSSDLICQSIAESNRCLGYDGTATVAHTPL